MLEFKKELITPAIAEVYLQSNISNRRVKAPIVLQYAKDMQNGRWKDDTAEMIKISKTGVILDGQHRLLAVKKSNTAIWFMVAKGLDDDVFDVLDTGSRRNASDAFKVKNIKHENSIPSIISMYNYLKLGKRIGIQKNDKATNAVLLEQYYQRENFWQNVARKSFQSYQAFAKILSPALIGGFYAYLSENDPEKAEMFINQLTTGGNITNNTINLLRNKLMQDKISPRKMPPTLKIALIIKTWNLFVKNEDIKLLKFDTVNENFPEFYFKKEKLSDLLNDFKSNIQCSNNQKNTRTF